MVRVAGTDPGTSSLDVLILEDGDVVDQNRFTPEEIGQSPTLPVEWLTKRGPFDLVAGPSGYGLPLVRNSECTEEHLRLMNLVRPDEQGRSQGVVKFSTMLRAFWKSDMPVVFLPGVIHLSSVPSYRKHNRIDMGTADKLCVTALALAQYVQHCHSDFSKANLCVVELGSAFTACMVIVNGRIVDGVGGTGGPLGWKSGGAWDGETAYWCSPLQKHNLFRGGASDLPDEQHRHTMFCESLVKCVAGLRAVHSFDTISVSGRLLEVAPDLGTRVSEELAKFESVIRLPSLSEAWVKHAAQGAAVLADGLVGGKFQDLVEQLELTNATGTVLDWLSPK
ncbi:MAG: DUF1464 family protein [Gemmataceae bacterium]